jgi:hypothetical protein
MLSNVSLKMPKSISSRLALAASLATIGLLPFSEAVAASYQTIAFDVIPNQILGISPFVIAAQASSLLPVAFTSTTPAVCNLAHDLVMLLTAGTCSITASQGDSASFSAATPVARSFHREPGESIGHVHASRGQPDRFWSVFSW